MHRTLNQVTVFDDALATLVADLAATMYAAEGVGLAANQIGIDLAVFVFDCVDSDGQRYFGAVCNPRLSLPEGRDRRLEEDEEGCLSLPGLAFPTPRALSVVATGQDRDGAPVRITGTGFLARALQHETDHLDGRLYLDRLTGDTRRQALRELRRVRPAVP